MKHLGPQLLKCNFFFTIFFDKDSNYFEKLWVDIILGIVGNKRIINSRFSFFILFHVLDLFIFTMYDVYRLTQRNLKTHTNYIKNTIIKIPTKIFIV